MAQQEGGWPLGLQPLNLRIDLVRNVDYFSGSLSLSTLITDSPTSSCSSSSSESDTEFTGSFFRDRSITLGSLIGIASLFDLSNRPENSSRIKKKSNGNNRAAKHWFSSLCTKAQLSGEVTASAPSLGHFLEAERRASDSHRTSRRADVAIAYELEELAPARHSGSEPNSLFSESDGHILPPASNRDGRNDLVGVGKAKTELNSSRSGISEGFWGLRSAHRFALLSPCMSGNVAE